MIFSWEVLKGSRLSYTLVNLLDILKLPNPSKRIKVLKIFRHYFSMLIVMEMMIYTSPLGVVPFLKLVPI